MLIIIVAQVKVKSTVIAQYDQRGAMSLQFGFGLPGATEGAPESNIKRNQRRIGSITDARGSPRVGSTEMHNPLR